MKKKLLSLCVTVLLLAALLPLTVQTAFAQDYDRILSYQVDVTPNVNDGQPGYPAYPSAGRRWRTSLPPTARRAA